MLGGRLFQIRGPATANDLSPSAVLVCRTLVGAVCFIVMKWHGLCDCCAGWTGEFCEMNIDECALSVNSSEPLCHSGVCSDTPGSYTCNCDDTGYTGMSLY